MVVHASPAFWAAAVGLLSLCTLPWESTAVRPSDHGLAFQRNTTVAPPATAAFFRGDGGGSVFPEAKNVTGWDWEARATPMSVGGGRDRLRRVLVAVAAACGGVGVALLAATAVAYLVQARREKARQRRDAGAGAAVCVSVGG